MAFNDDTLNDGVTWDYCDPLAGYLCPTCGWSVREDDPMVKCKYCHEEHKGVRHLVQHCEVIHSKEPDLNRYRQFLEETGLLK